MQILPVAHRTRGVPRFFIVVLPDHESSILDPRGYRVTGASLDGNIAP